MFQMLSPSGLAPLLATKGPFMDLIFPSHQAALIKQHT